MEKLVNRLCDVLNKQLSTTSDMDFNDENVASEERKLLEEQKRVVKIDAIFGSFAVDVIYNIGFDLDRNFLFNHDLYEVTVLYSLY